MNNFEALQALLGGQKIFHPNWERSPLEVESELYYQIGRFPALSVDTFWEEVVRDLKEFQEGWQLYTPPAPEPVFVESVADCLKYANVKFHWPEGIMMSGRVNGIYGITRGFDQDEIIAMSACLACGGRLEVF